MDGSQNSNRRSNLGFQDGSLGGGAPCRGMSVLLVDDDPVYVDCMAVLLRGLGHRVRIASSAAVAYEFALRDPPDVLLLDIALPDMDGWQLARRLREPTWKKMPFVIVLTGYGSEEDHDRSREAGVHLHLVKPVDVDVLRRVLQRFHEVVDSPDASSGAEINRGVREPRGFAGTEFAWRDDQS